MKKEVMVQRAWLERLGELNEELKDILEDDKVDLRVKINLCRISGYLESINFILE